MIAEPPPSKASAGESLRSAKILDRLLRSELFQSLQLTFQAATGLPLELHAASDDEVTACRGSVNQNPFCGLLNRGKEGCQKCLIAQKCLASPESRRVQSIACFAGLQETAVPVTIEGTVIAHLKTGQIFHERPTRKDFKKVAAQIDDLKGAFGELEEAYLKTPVIKQDRYQAMVTLLASFALQLNKLANQIEWEEEMDREDLISQAQEYIEQNLREILSLDKVAEELHISTFHFCRKFKEATGLTFTEYLVERRVELAKEALERGDLKIIDIAFEVGFQSLSQFNRSFLKVTGVPPSRFRRQCV